MQGLIKLNLIIFISQHYYTHAQLLRFSTEAVLSTHAQHQNTDRPLKFSFPPPVLGMQLGDLSSQIKIWVDRLKKGKAVRTSSRCRCCKQAIIATSHHAWQQSVAVVASRQVFSIYVNKDNTPSNWRGLSCSGCKQSPSEDWQFEVLSWNMQLNISPLVSSLKNHLLQQDVCRLKD